MKKTKVLVLAALTAIVTACGTLGQSGSGTATGSILGSVLTDVLQGGTISNVITSVIGAQTVTANDLVGSWKYSNPGCAFTSDKLLAKAGGEVVAAEIKSKMLPYYQQIGINSQNTVITFNQDGTYSANFRGTPMSGKWTFDASTYKVTLSGMLLSINCYAKRNANGIGLLFEAKKLLTVLQTVAAMSGNSNIQAVGEISKSYDGVRLGFDYTR
jgi:hypothetical protein